MPIQTVKKWSKGKKDQITRNEFFFSKRKNNNTFIYLLAAFILQNFRKILGADPELLSRVIKLFESIKKR